MKRLLFSAYATIVVLYLNVVVIQSLRGGQSPTRQSSTCLPKLSNLPNSIIKKSEDACAPSPSFLECKHSTKSRSRQYRKHIRSNPLPIYMHLPMPPEHKSYDLRRCCRTYHNLPQAAL